MLGQLKNSLLVFFAIQLACSSQVFSSGSLLFGAERDFKCYIEFSNGEAAIRNQFAKSPEQAKAQLMKRFSKKADQNMEIIVIKECIKIQDNFSSYEAHKLDLITPQ